ncbi:SUKH-3 domain-containing protein [Nocardia sp. NPDC059240]|uniref:SUKH-3 domain-containing protein n=1 Tax=Nocardia sp. NPDC059240 TaxID=3346786 RepID=UPI0036A0B68D
MRFFWPNPITTQAITAAGWTSSRRIDITDWRDRLESEGYHISRPAASILESFGNLTLQIPNLLGALWSPDPFFFDPIDVANGMYERYADIEAALGHHMTPLAANATGTAFLLMLDDARVVSDGPLALHLLGETFPQALDLIVRRHRTPQPLLSHHRGRTITPIRQFQLT